jgi:hypothetical protein
MPITDDIVIFMGRNDQKSLARFARVFYIVDSPGTDAIPEARSLEFTTLSALQKHTVLLQLVYEKSMVHCV